MRKSVNLGITDLLELSQAILEKGNSIRFQAKGWSMRPFIQDGDFIIVSPVQNSSIMKIRLLFIALLKNIKTMAQRHFSLKGMPLLASLKGLIYGTYWAR